jgi:HlyD family secretion protein
MFMLLLTVVMQKVDEADLNLISTISSCMRLIGFIIILLLVSSCDKKQESTQARVQDITESVYASGTIKSVNQYQVFSTVNGIIRNKLVTEGDIVKKGQPLFRILNEASQLNTQNARLAAEYSSVAANANKLNELLANIEMAQTKLQTDSSLLQRQRNLWAQQIGTRNELDLRELSFKNSQDGYHAAIYRYNDLKKQLDFAAKQSRKNLEISTSLSSDFTVKSEIAGKVYRILKEKGEIVNPQTPIAIIGATEQYELDLEVDEYDIVKIQLGQKVLVNMDAYKGKTYEARVTKINPIMNDRTRSFTIEAEFTNPPPALFPNLTVEANILIQSKQKAITIPRSYLVQDSFVVVKDKGKTKVETGLKDYQVVEITKGINKDDVIVKPEE